MRFPTRGNPRFPGECPDRAGKNEIARHFHLNASERVTLKRMLKDMQAEGLLEKRQRRLIAQGQLGPVLVGEVIGRDSDGELLAIPWIGTKRVARPRASSSSCRSVAGAMHRLRPAPAIGR